MIMSCHTGGGQGDTPNTRSGAPRSDPAAEEDAGADPAAEARCPLSGAGFRHGRCRIARGGERKAEGGCRRALHAIFTIDKSKTTGKHFKLLLIFFNVKNIEALFSFKTAACVP